MCHRKYLRHSGRADWPEIDTFVPDLGGDTSLTISAHKATDAQTCRCTHNLRDGGKLDACRAVFGDDTEDYGEALKKHYAEGVPPDWQEHYVSAYATTHAWEDFAETWAHYLHIVDTLEMASAFGLQVQPNLQGGGQIVTKIDFNPYDATSIEQIMDAWFPFVLAMNSVNRAMGNRDLYPFVLAPPVIRKLGLIHDLVHGNT
jgi:hypothetical protein